MQYIVNLSLLYSLEEIFLLKAEEYNYMRNGLVKIPGINDENDFEDTREAMDIMQMTPEEQTGNKLTLLLF